MPAAAGMREAADISRNQGPRISRSATRKWRAATAEIKRMYVDPSVRGRGIGRTLVEALEREARLASVTKIVLETGTRLAPASKLYEAMGYARIPLFGEYLSSPGTSLCFSK